MTTPRDDILTVLTASPGLRLPELVERTGWARETIRHHLDRLKREHKVEYKQDIRKDARYRMWYLSEEK